MAFLSVSHGIQHGAFANTLALAVYMVLFGHNSLTTTALPDRDNSIDKGFFCLHVWEGVPWKTAEQNRGAQDSEK